MGFWGSIGNWFKGAARKVGSFVKEKVIDPVGNLIRNPKSIPSAIGNFSRSILRPAVNMLGFIPHPKAQILAAGAGKGLDAVEDISGKVDKAINN